MSSFSIFQIAGSALTAQSQRMNIAASNIANADSVMQPDGQPYRARLPVFQVQPHGGTVGVGGVRVVRVLESDAPPRMQYEPGNPLADAEGYVTMPNVDPVAEMVNVISAARSYQASVEVINTSKTLMARTLSLGQ
ncbi:flagellar basal body rod protein FlgC [Castellaniella sp.]|uniref:flagellar basal body rod protein FlgC n=1 Tax=Castellaniella sp. TaxID=1955812 RepID=UPI003567ED89